MNALLNNKQNREKALLLSIFVCKDNIYFLNIKIYCYVIECLKFTTLFCVF